MCSSDLKVTPSSKVVGDMAIAMVAAGQSRQTVEDPKVEIAFPDSVVSFFRGELGQPPNGFPSALQAKVLKEQQPLTVRPGSTLASADLDAARSEAVAAAGREITDEELYSHLMYPRVFADFAAMEATYGPVDKLPTPVYFYGMAPGQSITVQLEPGVDLDVRCLDIGQPNTEGWVWVFFELNGQARRIQVADKHVEIGRAHV